MVQKLQAENRKLRQLCSRPEQESIFAEEYRTADAPVEARKVAIPAIRRDDSALPVAECTRGSQDPDDMEQAASAGMLQLADTAAPESYESQENQSVCGCSPNDGDSWPADEDVLNTTLCAIADELINQYNSRGVDMVDIRRKLWDGFRKGLGSGEGCRVQNQILFQVLDEISND